MVIPCHYIDRLVLVVTLMPSTPIFMRPAQDAKMTNAEKARQTVAKKDLLQIPTERTDKEEQEVHNGSERASQSAITFRR